ncbi:MAG: SDR family NAD(P)-dependent oxidoreductase [Armatimonadota bacterium]
MDDRGPDGAIVTGGGIATVAIVTGGGGGIGGAIAARLAADGNAVAVADLNPDAAQRTADAIARGGGRSTAYPLDVTDPHQVNDVVTRIVADLGRVDILVNSAGIQFNCASVDLLPKDYLRILGVNLNGTVYCCQAAGRQMIRQGGGVIINLSSLASRFGWPRRMPYAVTKAGVAALTRSLAVEWAPYHVRVVAIAPGYVATELVRSAFAQGHVSPDAVLSEIPQRRLAEPEEIASLASFLASPAAAYITGQEIVADGGFSVYKL